MNLFILGFWFFHFTGTTQANQNLSMQSKGYIASRGWIAKLITDAEKFEFVSFEETNLANKIVYIRLKGWIASKGWIAI